MNKTDFINHCVTTHPQSQSTIESLGNKQDGIKTEEYIENLPYDLEEKFNPWDVKSLKEFCYYCCPKCPSKFVNKSDADFVLFGGDFNVDPKVKLRADQS